MNKIGLLAAMIVAMGVSVGIAQELAPPAPPVIGLAYVNSETGAVEPIQMGQDAFILNDREYVMTTGPVGSFVSTFFWSPVANLGDPVGQATYSDNLTFFFSGGSPGTGGTGEVVGPCYKVQFVGTKLYLQRVTAEGGDVMIQTVDLTAWNFHPPGTFELRVTVDIAAQRVKVEARRLGSEPADAIMTLLDYQLPPGSVPIVSGGCGMYNREDVWILNMTAAVTDFTLTTLDGNPLLPPAVGGDNNPPPPAPPPMENSPDDTQQEPMAPPPSSPMEYLPGGN